MPHEHQIVYDLQSSVQKLQALLNYMDAWDWELTYVNANTRYAIFRRNTDSPDPTRTVWTLPKDWPQGSQS